MRQVVCAFGNLSLLLAGCAASAPSKPAATYVSAGATIRVVSFDVSLRTGDLRRLADQAEREYTQLKTLFRNDVGQVTVTVRDSGIARHFPPASIRIPSRLIRNATAITAHEIVHLLAQGWASQVLKKGLAVYLQERLGEQSGWPNYRRSVDAAARYWRRRNDIGVSTLAEAETAMRGGRQADADLRRAAYSLSGSFVKWLIEVRLGGNLDRFMTDIYRSGDLQAATGQSAAVLERAWARTLDDQ